MYSSKQDFFHHKIWKGSTKFFQNMPFSIVLSIFHNLSSNKTLKVIYYLFHSQRLRAQLTYKNILKVLKKNKQTL